ncbi:MAG: SDR family NAD(P)-dependent oxidoreductase [Candidatus Krumholzibacteria bacterium]|nr:SDR family NAD(P)-dependent oxidoreductase [Candidatus Krumholzibacteria bacterium]
MDNGMDHEMDQSNCLAIVTGTSSGVGLAAASALLSEGWSVTGLSRREAALDSPRYQHLAWDLGDTEGLENFADEHLAPLLGDPKWERVGLVNNAAFLGSLREVSSLKPEQLSRIFAINTVAPIWLMGLTIRAVPAQTELRIANISSGAAVQGIAGLADYCASKAALRLAGMALGAELDQGAAAGRDSGLTRILSYEPGVVDTGMQDAARATDPAEFPSHDIFQGFAKRGDLQSPAAVVGEIVDFLSASGGETFSERRFGVT